MKCNCEEKFIEGMKNKHPEFEHIEVENGMELYSGKTSFRVEITVVGQKKKKAVSWLHSYCPYCGKRYEGYS